MKGNRDLLQHEDHWQSRVGGFIHQQSVIFRGKDLHRDLGERSWLELYLFGITGRSFTPTEMKILNAIWVYTSYPDPRIWNNRVAALAGTVRSTAALAIGAATVASEAEIFGAKPLLKGVRFLVDAQTAIEKGATLEDLVRVELKRSRKLPGYGRPNASGDERIAPMLAFLKELGYPDGPYIQLAFEIEKILAEGRWRFRLNYAGLVAALCAELKLSPRESYLFVTPVFTAGIMPCFMDAYDQSEGCLFPLRCARIDYLGPGKRSWT